MEHLIKPLEYEQSLQKRAKADQKTVQAST